MTIRSAVESILTFTISGVIVVIMASAVAIGAGVEWIRGRVTRIARKITRRKPPTPPPPLKSRDRFLEEARALFLERGFEAVSLEEIAGKAEEDLLIVRANFGSVEEVAYRLMQKPFDAVWRRQLVISTPPPPPPRTFPPQAGRSFEPEILEMLLRSCVEPIYEVLNGDSQPEWQPLFRPYFVWQSNADVKQWLPKPSRLFLHIRNYIGGPSPEIHFRCQHVVQTMNSELLRFAKSRSKRKRSVNEIVNKCMKILTIRGRRPLRV